MADSEPSARVGRAFAVVLALLLLCEAVAQVIVYRFADGPFHSLTLYNWSPYGLVRNNPRLTSDRFSINANGFRASRDFAKAKPANTFRVLMLGGSVLYSGLGGPRTQVGKYGRVPSSQTIAPFLEARLRADPAFAGKTVEVINGAVNFNRIVESSGAFLADYMYYAPDFVIVMGAVNNFATPRAHGAIDASGTDLQGPHPWLGEFQRLVNANDLPATLERIWRSGGEHSAALALADKIVPAAADKWVAVTQRLAPPQPPASPATLETPVETGRYFRIYAIYADAIIAATRTLGAGVAFAWEPMLSDIGDLKPLTIDERGIYAAVRRRPAQVAQYDRVRQLSIHWAAQQGVPFVDTTPDVIAYPGEVYMDYGHYTAAGNRFIAAALYRHLAPQLRAQAKRPSVRF